MDRELKNLQLLLIGALGYVCGLLLRTAWEERKAFGKKLGFENLGFFDVPVMNYRVLTNSEYLATGWMMEALWLVALVTLIGVISWSWHRKPQMRRLDW